MIIDWTYDDTAQLRTQWTGAVWTWLALEDSTGEPPAVVVCRIALLGTEPGPFTLIGTEPGPFTLIGTEPGPFTLIGTECS